MEPLSDISRQLEQALRGYADKSGPSQLMQRVKPTIEREVNIAAKRLCAKWEAIVSGSQCQGTAVERSDLDILIQNRGSGMHATRQNRCLLAEDCKQGLEKALKDEDVEVSQQAYDMANKLTLAWPDGQRITADLVFETTTHARLTIRGDEDKFNSWPDVINAVILFKKFLEFRKALPKVPGVKIEALALLCVGVDQQALASKQACMLYQSNHALQSCMSWLPATRCLFLALCRVAHRMRREGAGEPINGIQVFFVMLKTLKAASSDTKHLDGLSSEVQQFLPPKPFLTKGAARALGEASCEVLALSSGCVGILPRHVVLLARLVIAAAAALSSKLASAATAITQAA
ncbi:hypothetical protein QJQ45_013009 [Haematococcus lacustris]|nr:hypothetical protein QJQ45_013009 [Haematococcus lacustris]